MLSCNAKGRATFFDLHTIGVVMRIVGEKDGKRLSGKGRKPSRAEVRRYGKTALVF
jgi:hypothetical protein